MSLPKLAAALAGLTLAATAAQLPELRIEPTAGGSIFYVKNTSSQPLTAYLIELVNYPGSSFSLWQDVAAEPIAPGVEKRIQVANMTVGAVPDYVKIQAALYADGSSAGVPERVTQFIERRRFLLATTRETIQRIEKAQGKDAAIADLKQWSGSFQPLGKGSRNSQAAINQQAASGLLSDVVSYLKDHSVAEALSGLKASELALGGSL